MSDEEALWLNAMARDPEWRVKFRRQPDADPAQRWVGIMRRGLEFIHVYGPSEAAVRLMVKDQKLRRSSRDEQP